MIDIYGNTINTKDEKQSGIFVWNEQNLKQYNELLEMMDPKDIDMPSPYLMNKKGFKKPGLIYNYSKEEEEEFKSCSKDVVRFSEKYCKTMTDDGIQNVRLYPHQERVLREFQRNKMLILLAPRQSQKTTVSAFFIMHYVCFSIDKNILIAANRGETMQEILDKIAIIYENLPFFLKPGIRTAAKKRLEFDNGCRIIGQTTTLNSGLGFAIHLLYCDEFAHIPNHIVYPFYRSVYPTMSASKVARMIITSTPNGTNLFFKLWKGANSGKSENGGKSPYYPLEVKWYEVPGRDEEWKKREIAALGDEDSFNQEYGCQFLNSSNKSVDIDNEKRFEKMKKDFYHRNLLELDKAGVDYNNLIWDPDVEIDFKNNRFVISVDIAEGGGGDFSVANIFRVEPMTNEEIDNLVVFKNEFSFLKLRQVGMFRSNEMSIPKFIELVKEMILKLFEQKNILLVVEMNFQGPFFVQKLLDDPRINEYIFLHTKHAASLESNVRKIGVKLNMNNKKLYISQFNNFIKNSQIEIYEKNNIVETTSFGTDNNGHYTSEVDHDDMAMTCFNLAPVFDSLDWQYFLDSYYDTINDKIRNKIAEKLNNIKLEISGDNSYMNFYETIHKVLQ
jgi:hypothetical protein